MCVCSHLCETVLYEAQRREIQQNEDVFVDPHPKEVDSGLFLGYGFGSAGYSYRLIVNGRQPGRKCVFFGDYFQRRINIS